MSHRKRRAVEMTVPWKAWKTNNRFSTLPTAPWKSLRDFHIPTAPATTTSFMKIRQNRTAAGLRPWPTSYRVVVVDREK
jgi:hypothetical protein